MGLQPLILAVTLHFFVARDNRTVRIRLLRLSLR